MVGRYVVSYYNQVQSSLSNSQEIEASLHCIMSIQEAIEMETVAHLDRLFSPAILGRLPSTGRSRVRRTALGVIGGFFRNPIFNSTTRGLVQVVI